MFREVFQGCREVGENLSTFALDLGKVSEFSQVSKRLYRFQRFEQSYQEMS